MSKTVSAYVFNLMLNNVYILKIGETIIYGRTFSNAKITLRILTYLPGLNDSYKKIAVRHQA